MTACPRPFCVITKDTRRYTLHVQHVYASKSAYAIQSALELAGPGHKLVSWTAEGEW